MIVEFTSPSPFGLLPAIASATGTVIENGRIDISPPLGTGYIKAILVNPRLMMLIRQYELKEELIIKRGPLDDGANIILLAFHNLHRSALKIEKQAFPLPSVQVSTAELDYEDLFPSNSTVNTLIILIQLDMLRDLVNPKGSNVFLQQVLSGSQSFLFEEIISPEMQDITDQIINNSVDEGLQDFYYRLKAEELIYLFFATLAKRDNLTVYPPNREDVKAIYKIRDKIVADLGVNPNLTDLAKYSGMSETKIKRLFKQIFGSTLYDYYQSIRMKQAAFLLKEHNLSVSEAGYQLGFSNLSHFARIFERYIGVKPKKYAKVS